MEQHAGAHQRYSQALEGLGAVVRDYENDLATAAADAEYWRHEAETFRRKYQEEKARNERLRRVLCLLQAPAAGAPTAGAAAAAAAALPHLLPTARSVGGSLTSAASFTRRATVAAAAAAAAANAQHQELSLALAAGAAPPGSLTRASHDGAVGRDTHPPPLLPPQGSAPLPGGRAAVARWPSGLQRAVSTPTRSAGGTPTSAAAAAAAAAARVGSFATSLGGALGAIESPKLRRQTIESLFSMMMAYTVAQGVAAGDAGDGAGDDGEEPLSSISIDDDEGSSGVGLAAAAAAAAAMARAWAKAASREQREASSGVAGSVGGAGGAGGTGAGGAGAGGGKAGFRLVATVTNKMGKRRQSQANLALSNSASQDSLLDTSPYASSSSLAGGTGGAPSPSPLGASAAAANGGGAPRPGSAPPRAAGSGGDAGSSSDSALPPPQQQQQQQQPTGAAPTSGPSGQGSNIALHWLSRPRNVLVMRKPGCTTEGAFQAAVEWLTERHINVYVEPSVYRDMMQQRKQQETCQDKGRQQQEQQQQQGSEGQGSKEQQQQQGSEGQGSKEQQQEQRSEGQGSKEQQQEQTAAAQASTPPQPPRPRPAGSSSGLSVSFAAHSTGGASGTAAATSGDGRDSSGGGAPDRPPGELRTWEVAPGGAGEYLPEWLSNSLDFVVVFGGDGTVLWTCHMFGNRSVPPVVPFNLGSLGFLTPFDPAALRRVMSRIVRGGFPLQLRHRLHCTLVRSSALPEDPPTRTVPRPASISGSLGDGGALTHTASAANIGMPALPAGLVAFAEGNGCPAGVCLESEERVVLNEVVLDRGISPFLTNLETYCDGNFVTNVQGDGLIVATPTGSTAYSLAAGGSMVHPQVPCILFTPICPHSLSFRPLMFPDHVVLCIRVPAGIRSQVWCSFDGKERTELHPGDAVLIRLSKWPLPTVTSASDASTDWFSSVRSNLGWNARKLQGGAGQ